MKQMCEKCYAQVDRAMQQKNAAVTRQTVGEAIPTEDLLAKLQAPSKIITTSTKNQDEEIQELSQKIYQLCQDMV